MIHAYQPFIRLIQHSKCISRPDTAVSAIYQPNTRITPTPYQPNTRRIPGACPARCYRAAVGEDELAALARSFGGEGGESWSQMTCDMSRSPVSLGARGRSSRGHGAPCEARGAWARGVGVGAGHGRGAWARGDGAGRAHRAVEGNLFSCGATCSRPSACAARVASTTFRPGDLSLGWLIDHLNAGKGRFA